MKTIAEKKAIFEQTTFQFFDEKKEFKILADKVGGNSFFITGASGVFGQWIISFFEWTISRGIACPSIRLLLRDATNNKYQSHNCIQGDIVNFEKPSEKFEYLIHLAAPSAKDTFSGMDNSAKLTQLIHGTEHILNFAETNILNRTLMVSSGAVYGGFGPNRKTPISEIERTAPLFSSVDYGLAIGKRVLEAMTSERCRNNNLDASIARCFSFLGPELPTNLHYAAGNFLSNALSGKPIVINGDGTPIRSFLYLGDMVYWLLTILFDGSKGEDYNVGSSKGVSIRELAEIISSVVGAADIHVLGKSNKSRGNPENYFYIPDTTKAKTQLGVPEFTTLKQSLVSFMEYELKKIS